MINKNSRHDLIPYKPAGHQVFNSFDEAWQAAQEAEIQLRGLTYITYYKDNAIDSENVHCIVAVSNANKNEPHLFLTDMMSRELKESPNDPDGEFVNKPFPVVIQELNELILKLTAKASGVEMIDILDGDTSDSEPGQGETEDPGTNPGGGDVQPVGSGVGLLFIWDGTRLGIKREDLNEYEYRDLKGEPGVDGQNGQDGLDGAQGPQGEQGQDGSDGLDGQDGQPGVSLEFQWDNERKRLGVKRSDESDFSFSEDLTGPQGLQGEQSYYQDSNTIAVNGNELQVKYASYTDPDYHGERRLQIGKNHPNYVSHIEVGSTSQTDLGLLAIGSGSQANGGAAFAVGQFAVADGTHSIAFPYTHTIGDFAHTEGEGTLANNEAEHAQGKYNKSNSVSIPQPIEYVDLDLPSGLLWAKWNLGANSETEYGDYYAWGETETKSSYTWENYKWGTENNLTKYNSTDGKTQLDPEDDAAHVNLGDGWRMPTLDEFEELRTETYNELSYINGIIGWKFTSKKDGSKFVFIPSGGYCDGTLNGAQWKGGFHLNSIAYDEYAPYRLSNHCDIATVEGTEDVFCKNWETYRYRGFNIRAVHNEIKNTIHSVGIGTSDINRKNAFEITEEGDMYVVGLGGYDGTNPASADTLQDVVNNINVNTERGSKLFYSDMTYIDGSGIGVDARYHINRAGNYIVDDSSFEWLNSYSYTCVQAGDENTSLWVWAGKLKGDRGSKIFYSDNIDPEIDLETGDETGMFVIQDAGSYLVGDMVITSEGDVYTCSTEGDENTSLWEHKLNIKGVDGLDGQDGADGQDGQRGSKIVLLSSLTPIGWDENAQKNLVPIADNYLVDDVAITYDGNVYACISEGNEETSLWEYRMNIKGDDGLDGQDGQDGAIPDMSHITGYETVTTNDYEHAEGTYNKSNSVPIPQPIEYVDLGLPSGLLWTKWNLGANSETEYGDYYAWGETEPKSSYIWATYKWGDPNNGGFTKYNSTDGKTQLDPEDDAAHVNLGDGWRMPTETEIQELLNNCTKVWITDYQGSGVGGRLFTAQNGNTLFIPVTGYKSGSSVINDDIYCEFWSKCIYINLYYSNDISRSDGKFYCFDEKNPDSEWVGTESRYYGIPIRPVISPSDLPTINTIHSTGIGTSDNDRKNAFEIMDNGDVYVKGVGDYDGTNPDSADTLQEVVRNISAQTGYNSATDSYTECVNETAGSDPNDASLANTLNTASGIRSHAEGLKTTASSVAAHSEGKQTTASNTGSHAEGCFTSASGVASHAEGQSTYARGYMSHAEGYHTETKKQAEHAEGQYNVSNNGATDAEKTIHSIGIGYKSNGVENYMNAIEVMLDGSVYIKDIGNYDGTTITAEGNNVQTLQAYIASLEARILTLEGVVNPQTTQPE